MYDLIAEEIEITGHGGDTINAYRARPLGESPAGGVLVIHHMPGWDEWSKEMTRKFAAHGYNAICPNLYYREGPTATPDDAAAAARAAGGVDDNRLLGDAEGAIGHLRSLENSNGKIGVIGYCSGGRQSYLIACELDVNAAVDCYGAFVVGDPPPGMKLRPVIDRTEKMRCPLLGLFGADDTYPSPEQTAQIEDELKKHGKVFEFHTYPGAGHAFFNYDRTAYRPEAAADGWERIWEWYGRYLQG